MVSIKVEYIFIELNIFNFPFLFEKINGRKQLMKEEKIILNADAQLVKIAEERREETEKILEKRLERGKTYIKIREDSGSYIQFTEVVESSGLKPDYVNKEIRRIKMHNSMSSDTGRRTVLSLTNVLLNGIYSLKKESERKYKRLMKLIDDGYNFRDIRDYLSVNAKQEPTTLKIEEVSETFEDIKETLKQTKIRKMTKRQGERLMKFFKEIRSLLLECKESGKRKKVAVKINEMSKGLAGVGINYSI